MIPRWLTITLVFIVSTVWVANIAVDMLSDYQANDAINGIFMAVVGGLVADYMHGHGRRRGTDDDDS